ncbi:hypothetical protein ACFWY5_39010 [Nonomuraea sp. NPDC059007]|uniref:hypothetical protein n=1 Tax=Nonomuraea sp. NPDC059007 TaxID=3346692 RepID=UPI003677834C
MNDTQNTAHRAQLIADLRQFARYLEEHPALPVSQYGVVSLSFNPISDTDAEAIAEVERVAALHGLPVRRRSGQHFATLVLGSVEYSIVAIEQEAEDAYDAHQSYRSNFRLHNGSGA